jgi:hypothetical protein
MVLFWRLAIDLSLLIPYIRNLFSVLLATRFSPRITTD